MCVRAPSPQREGAGIGHAWDTDVAVAAAQIFFICFMVCG
jgi:hypothetical protein